MTRLNSGLSVVASQLDDSTLKQQECEVLFMKRSLMSVSHCVKVCLLVEAPAKTKASAVSAIIQVGYRSHTRVSLCQLCHKVKLWITFNIYMYTYILP